MANQKGIFPKEVFKVNIGQEEIHTILCLLCLKVHKSLPF